MTQIEEAALRNKLAEKIESIIRESVKPMANIGDIKIVDVSGLPGFSGTSGVSSGVVGKEYWRWKRWRKFS